jgi:Lrp/AsnC family transcriptional regulator, regulator for asnA, asnC and gidA
MEQVTIDDLDRKILNLLMEDGRMRYHQMAKKLSVTIGTVHNRIKALKQRGVLKKFVPIIDNTKVGYGVTVIVDIIVTQGRIDDVIKRYKGHKNITSIYFGTGEFDISFVAKFRDTQELNEFARHLATFDAVTKTNTRVMLDIEKETSTPFPL